VGEGGGGLGGEAICLSRISHQLRVGGAPRSSSELAQKAWRSVRAPLTRLLRGGDVGCACRMEATTRRANEVRWWLEKRCGLGGGSWVAGRRAWRWGGWARGSVRKRSTRLIGARARRRRHGARAGARGHRGERGRRAGAKCGERRRGAPPFLSVVRAAHVYARDMDCRRTTAARGWSVVSARGVGRYEGCGDGDGIDGWWRSGVRRPCSAALLRLPPRCCGRSGPGPLWSAAFGWSTRPTTKLERGGRREKTGGAAAEEADCPQRRRRRINDGRNARTIDRRPWCVDCRHITCPLWTHQPRLSGPSVVRAPPVVSRGRRRAAARHARPLPLELERAPSSSSALRSHGARRAPLVVAPPRPLIGA
jgi:hypothetical protein